MKHPISALLLFASLLFQPEFSASQTRTGEIAGQIRQLNGEPVAGIRVVAIEESRTGEGRILSLTETDREGRYRLEGIPPGRYYVMAGKFDFPVYFPGVVAVTSATAVNVGAGATTANVDFSLTAELIGAVFGEDGSPAVDIVVRVSKVGVLGQFVQAATDAQGKYIIKGLALGEHLICVEYKGETGLCRLADLRGDRPLQSDFDLKQFKNLRADSK